MYYYSFAHEMNCWKFLVYFKRSQKSLLSKPPLKPKPAIFSLYTVNGLITQVGYAMTTFQRETDQPVIGFDMGGNVGLGDVMSLYYKWPFQLQNKFKKIILIITD